MQLMFPSGRKNMSNTMRLLQAGQVPPSPGLYTAYSLHSLETALQQAESGERVTCVVPCFPPSENCYYLHTYYYLHTFQFPLVDTLGAAHRYGDLPLCSTAGLRRSGPWRSRAPGVAIPSPIATAVVLERQRIQLAVRCNSFSSSVAFSFFAKGLCRFHIFLVSLEQGGCIWRISLL